MALIQWKQIDSDISGSKQLTGSLYISGTISADQFIGIDPTNIFTGSVSASVSPDGTIFTISSGSDNLITVDSSGNMVVEGSVTAQEFFTEIVSASILFESGSSLFGNSLDDTHTFTGSLLVSSSGLHQISGSVTINTENTGSTAIYTNNTTVGYPSSNEWQDNLDGSYFNNFTHETHISEILRFMAGVISSSLDVADATPNTKTWGSVSTSHTLGSTTTKSSLLNGVLGSTYENAKLSVNWETSAYIDITTTGSYKAVQNYLIGKGFLLNSETGSGGFDNDTGTNPFNGSYGSRIPSTILSQGSFGTNSFTITANAAGSSTTYSNSNYFGLGNLTNGGATPYYVRIYGHQSYSDNYSDQTPTGSSTFTTSSFIDYSISSFGSSNGLELAKILTSQPAVIPSAYQDGDFNNVAGGISGRKYVGGATTATSISASGYYRVHDISVGLKTGSMADYQYKDGTSSSTRFYLYAGDLPSDITTGTRTATVSNVELNRTSFSATSRSLSGAPYLSSVSYAYTYQGEVSGSFDPGYAYSSTPLSISNPSNTWSSVGSTSLSNNSVSVNSNGVQTNSAARGVLSSDKGTQRTSGDIPRIDDICFATASYSFSLSNNRNNVVQNRSSQQTLNYNLSFRIAGTNWKGSSQTNTSSTLSFYSSSLFGQNSSKGSMAIYSYAQGYDNGSLTGTSETFTGEDFRIQINNNVLGFNGDSFTTNTFVGESALGDYDLQVKPGYLVDPGGNYGYWFDSGFGSGTYKYYIRRFQTSGAKTSMTLNIGKTLVNWDSTSDGIAAAILFKSSASGSGANDTLSTARIYDPSETNSNVVESAVSADNFKNPFTDNLDLYGNIGGSVSSTTYTIPLRNADGMYLDNSDNELYIIIRYKGDPSPVTSVSISTS